MLDNFAEKLAYVYEDTLNCIAYGRRLYITALQSDGTVTSAYSMVEVSEKRTDQLELRLTSSGESENGCAPDAGALV